MTCKHNWIPGNFGAAWRKPNHYVYQCTRCPKLIDAILNEKT